MAIISCDPYGDLGGYYDYDCDYGHGFSDIGYAGGWFGNFYYPGYGIFLFDSLGRRYPMREEYRRYWGQRRHDYYREYRGRDRAGDDDRREGRREDRRDGSRGADDQRRGVGGRGTGVTGAPNIDVSQDRGRGPEYGEANGKPGRRGSGGSNAGTVPAPRRQSLPILENVASVEQLPEPCAEPRQSKAPRERALEGGERPE